MTRAYQRKMICSVFILTSRNECSKLILVMKKSLQNKVNKFYCKLFTLNEELKLLRGEVEEEYDNVENKFNEIEEKYESVEEPSEALQEKYDTAEELVSEMDSLMNDLEEDFLMDFLGILEEYTEDIPEEMSVRLKDKPSIANEFTVAVEKKEYIESTGQFFLTLRMYTDVNPYPIRHIVYWNEMNKSWDHDINSDNMPWLGGGDLYKDFIKQRDELYTKFFNSPENLKATFTRTDK